MSLAPSLSSRQRASRAYLCAAALSAALLPAASHAQQQISPDAFIDAALGKTLTFTAFRTGEVVGVEQFLRRDLTVWIDSAGNCTYGKLTVEGPRMCFLYDAHPNPDNCWIPFLQGDQLVVMTQNPTAVQIVTKITNEPLSCPDQPLS